MVLYLKNVVRPSCGHRATCENSREAARAGKEWGGHNARNKSGGEKAGLQQAGSHSANARLPWGVTTARQVAEVPGATLDAHRLHAASVLF
jgi:hypothetical protein